MPRAGLSTQRVVLEAAAVADELGLEHLTLAAVAQRLGVRLPSLYKHVDGIDALRRHLAVLAARSLGEALITAAVGRAGPDAVVAIATAYRRFALDRPGLYAATLRAPAPDDVEHQQATDAVLRVVFAVLDGFDITGDDAIDATRTVRAALHGFVTLETAGGFGLPRDVDRSFERLVAGLTSVFATWAPTTTGVAP